MHHDIQTKCDTCTKVMTAMELGANRHIQRDQKAIIIIPIGVLSVKALVTRLKL